MPNGVLFRTRSTRRYVVAVFNGDDRWQADYRSDVESRALARWRENSRRGNTSAVVDTTTGTVVR
jgi:hypothetical protein